MKGAGAGSCRRGVTDAVRPGRRTCSHGGRNSRGEWFMFILWLHGFFVISDNLLHQISSAAYFMSSLVLEIHTFTCCECTITGNWYRLFIFRWPERASKKADDWRGKCTVRTFPCLTVYGCHQPTKANCVEIGFLVSSGNKTTPSH